MNYKAISISTIRDLNTYELTGSYDCTICLTENIDPNEVARHEVVTVEFRKGVKQTFVEDVCGDCVHQCEFCGEWIDKSTMLYGPAVRIRDTECNGKLSKPCHAGCAANHLLSRWGEDPHFDAECATRDEICRILVTLFWSVAA